jgi:uncharacterized protein (TIRG00374 family)
MRGCSQRSAALTRKARVRSTLIGLLISLACAGLLFRQVDLKQSWRALGQLNVPVLLAPLAVLLSNLPLRAWRWQMIFPASSRPRFWPCLEVMGISNMANFLLPARAGDLARCVLGGRTSSLSDSSRTLATLAVEKLLDGLALIGMVLFSLWALSPPHWVLELLRLAILIFGSALLALIILRYRAPLLISYVRATFRFLHLPSLGEKLDAPLASFADGLASVGSTGQMTQLLLLTAAIWATEAALIWGLATALSLSISIESAVVVSAVLGLGLLIPAAPGGFGTYELFGTEAFKLVGLTASAGLALTVVIHAWVFLANIFLGLCLLGVKGIRPTQLQDDLDTKQSTPGVTKPSGQVSLK